MDYQKIIKSNKMITIKIEKTTKDKIDRIKKKTGVPIKFIIDQAIKDYIKNNK